MPRLPVVFTVPHSGEWVPPEAHWLESVPAEALLTDIDRYVDELYAPVFSALDLPFVKTRVHRYVVDLNRLAEDVDQDSVEGAVHASGKFTRGLHWVETTRGVKLISKPISKELHQLLVDKYFGRFHRELSEVIALIQAASPGKAICHWDLHSMPSQGTVAHPDAGEVRADIVISDFEGRSASKDLVDLTINAFHEFDFNVAYNHPYKGGRITQSYGQPDLGHHTIQIELNRALYMDEFGSRNKKASFTEVQTRLLNVFQKITTRLLGETFSLDLSNFGATEADSSPGDRQ